MRINLGKCKSFEEFQIVLRTLEEVRGQDIGVKFYEGVLETSESSLQPSRYVIIENARAELLKNNPLFAKEHFQEQRKQVSQEEQEWMQIQKERWQTLKHLPALQETISLSIQRPLAEVEQLEQYKEDLVNKLKANSASNRDFVSIKTIDGEILKAPSALFPEVFSLASENSEGEPLFLDFDSETLNLFLDYQCGAAIANEISLFQLIELHRLADYLGVDSLYNNTIHLVYGPKKYLEREGIFLPFGEGGQRETIANVERLPNSSISPLRLSLLFQELLTPDSPSHTAEDFYKKLLASDRRTQKECRAELEEIAKRRVPPLEVSIAKYHLARFYREGIGGLKNERRAMELLKESAIGYQLCKEMLPKLPAPALAKEELETKNHHVHQMSLHQVFLRLRRSTEGMVTREFKGDLEQETLQIPQAFLPPDLNKKKLQKLDDGTAKLFIDFQYGLGIPADTPFETLVELYHLARDYEIQTLLKASSDLISKSFTDSNSSELLPRLFDLVLLEEKPSKYESSLVPFFLKQLGKAQRPTRKTFIEKLRPFVEQQNPTAQNLLGYCFENGYGIQKNGEYARRYYESAANNNNVLGRYNLARLCPDPEQAFAFFKQAADQGLSIAEDRVGSCLLNGTGTAKDVVSASVYFWRAANQGNSGGEYHLGICYLKGYGVDWNYNKALKLFKLCLDQGDPQGFYGLGLYDKILNCVDKGFKWFEEGAELENSDCLFELGNHYFSTNSPAFAERAFEYYERAADQGHPAAQCRVAALYTTGHRYNLKAAFKYYKMSADQGYVDAQYYVGVYYRDGYGTTANRDASFEYFKKAADSGHATAQEEVGNYYLDVMKNNALAFEYYKKAADQGSSFHAQVQTGWLYQHGFGVAKDLELACKYYEMLSSQNLFLYPWAPNFLGQFYKKGFTRQDGSVIEPDPKKAFGYFKTASNGGIRSASNELGICYEHGQGVEKNENLALLEYTFALSNGDHFPEAHYFLALHTSDPEQALYHLKEAAALGFQPAIDKLAEQS